MFNTWSRQRTTAARAESVQLSAAHLCSCTKPSPAEPRPLCGMPSSVPLTLPPLVLCHADHHPRAAEKGRLQSKRVHSRRKQQSGNNRASAQRPGHSKADLSQGTAAAMRKSLLLEQESLRQSQIMLLKQVCRTGVVTQWERVVMGWCRVVDGVVASGKSIYHFYFYFYHSLPLVTTRYHSLPSPYHLSPSRYHSLPSRYHSLPPRYSGT